jgi:hypothetical protein
MPFQDWTEPERDGARRTFLRVDARRKRNHELDDRFLALFEKTIGQSALILRVEGPLDSHSAPRLALDAIAQLKAAAKERAHTGAVGFFNEDGSPVQAFAVAESVHARGGLCPGAHELLAAFVADCGLDARAQILWETAGKELWRAWASRGRPVTGELKEGEEDDWGALRIAPGEVARMVARGPAALVGSSSALGFSGTEGKAMAAALARIWGRQEGKRAARGVSDAIVNAMGELGAALPKLSGPSSLTPEQKELGKLLRRAQALAAAVEEGARAHSEPLSEGAAWPEAAREAAERLAAKKEKLAAAQKEKEQKAAEPQGDAQAPGAAPLGRRGQQATNERIEVMRLAARHLDAKLAAWLIAEGLQGDAWTSSRHGPGVFEELAEAARYATYGGGEKERAAKPAAEIFSMIVDSGIDLLAEARKSKTATDNPYQRALAVLDKSDETGVWSHAWAKALTAQLQRQGITQEDAGAWLEEAREALRRGGDAALERRASAFRAHFDHWQLLGAAEGSGANASEAGRDGEPSPSARPARRPRAL